MTMPRISAKGYARCFSWLSKTYSDIPRHGTCSFQWYGRKLWQKSFWLSCFRFLVPIWLVWLFSQQSQAVTLSVGILNNSYILSRPILRTDVKSECIYCTCKISFQRLVMMKEVAVIAGLVGATRNQAFEEICFGTLWCVASHQPPGLVLLLCFGIRLDSGLAPPSTSPRK